MSSPAARRRSLLALILILPAVADAGPAIADDAAPTIRIVEPADGAVVKGPSVAVRVEVSNFTLERPSASGKKPKDVGHIHYWIDDRTSGMIYGPTPETSVRLLVSPGGHKIRAELVHDDHTSLAEGHRDKQVRELPGDAAFEHRSSMSTVSVDVR